MKIHCIYHGNCADGFGSAWVVRRALASKYKDITFHAGVYQRPPPQVEPGSLVLLVDFSYKRPVMKELAQNNNIVLVLDHHDSAMKALAPNNDDKIFRAPDNANVHWRGFIESLDYDSEGDIYTVFDMNRSGAGLTWDFFNPGVPRPKLLDHIEDRDLWRFKLPNTREIQAAVFSLPYDFGIWDELIAGFEDESATARAMVIRDGTAIERKHFKDIAELTRVTARPMRFRIPQWGDDGFEVVPVANLPYTMAADAGRYLCANARVDPKGVSFVERPSEASLSPFAGCFYDGPTGRNFSLRSADDGLDVSLIANHYGGGGHVHAAGFWVPFKDLAQFEP